MPLVMPLVMPCHGGLVACVRPYVPMLVGKGGVIAIGYALMGVTLLQYIGQMFNTPLGLLSRGTFLGG